MLRSGAVFLQKYGDADSVGECQRNIPGDLMGGRNGPRKGWGRQLRNAMDGKKRGGNPTGVRGDGTPKGETRKTPPVSFMCQTLLEGREKDSDENGFDGEEMGLGLKFFPNSPFRLRTPGKKQLSHRSSRRGVRDSATNARVSKGRLQNMEE